MIVLSPGFPPSGHVFLVSLCGLAVEIVQEPVRFPCGCSVFQPTHPAGSPLFGLPRQAMSPEITSLGWKSTFPKPLLLLLVLMVFLLI